MRLVAIFAALLVFGGCGEVVQPVCAAEETLCDDVCIDTAANAQNCGACGNACGGGESCVEGSCVLDDCPAGLVACDGDCINPETDRSFCGASSDCAGANAGVACDDGFVCEGGSCVLSCQNGLQDCSGVCTNTAIDPDNCGVCGTVCAPTEQCIDSVCTPVQVAVVFAEDFVTGSNDPADCTAWNEFKAALTDGGFGRVNFAGSRDPNGVSCTDPAAVAQLAEGLATETSVIVQCDGTDWQVCNRVDHLEFWVGGGTLCNPGNCPQFGHLIRPCNPFNGGFWGGINNNTGCAGPSQSINIRFE